MKKLFILFLTISFFSSKSQSIREHYQEGLQAYEVKDYELFKEKMFTIDTIRPNYPAVVYNLAGSYALLGDVEESIETLNKYILMDANQDFTKDEDFQSLQELKAFKKIQERQKSLTREIPTKKAFEWPLLSSHPESITFSPKLNSFFIGGVRDGNIWKIDNDSVPQLWAESGINSWAIMGLQVSPDDRYLWACTAAMENYEAYSQNDKGYSSVLKFDIETRECIAKYTLDIGHIFGDLITDHKGTVYVSDGTANKLYTVNEDKKQLEVFKDFSKTLFNMQGISFNDDQSAIYISDYIDGIYKLNIKTKEITKLNIEGDDVLLKGIDGLYFYENSLIGLHNGTKPNRVIRYHLNIEGDTIVKKEIISQAGILGEPTQGVFVNNEFFYITNSPWSSYDKDGNFNVSSKKLIVGKVK